MLLTSAFAVLCASFLCAAVQQPLVTPSTPQIGALSSLAPGSDWVHLTSSRHPDHKVRIQSHQGWCDPTARSYTGYIDTAYGKNLFFYFFESRDKPEEDPVVMWINGGPGASSAMGLFMEHGPCRIKDDPKGVNDTVINPYAWNEHANIFFLDQPIGVGFSHAEKGQTVSTTELAAIDVAAFVDIFVETFSEYKGRAFHMTGESYGGRYLPLFASAVYDQNTQLVKEGREPINLRSVMIGNGGTSLFAMIESIYDFMCTESMDLGRTIHSIANCVWMAEIIPKCKKMMQRDCIDTSDYTACDMALQYCDDPVWGYAALNAGVNRYNVNQTCTMEQYHAYLCMPETIKVSQYLNLPDVQALLGVDKHQGTWVETGRDVARSFSAAHDLTHQTWFYVANLLERGVKVLNYVGTLDAACDHFGQSKWMAAMSWTGQEAYLAAPTENWMVDGKVAGSIKEYENLTLLKVFGAGHLVPTDRPKEALEMFLNWIEGAK